MFPNDTYSASSDADLEPCWKVTPIERLFALEKQSAHSLEDRNETDELFVKWSSIHTIRLASLAASMATAFSALVQI